MEEGSQFFFQSHKAGISNNSFGLSDGLKYFVPKVHKEGATNGNLFCTNWMPTTSTKVDKF